MNGMVESLLDLSALEAEEGVFHRESFDVIEVLEVVAGRLFLDLQGMEERFSYELSEEPVFLYGDKKRIEQVFTNLLQNAKKHTVSHGKIHIKALRNEKDFFFSVYNQGDEIPKEELERIWDKFYRRKNATCSGSGLGLAIVSKILSMHQVPFGVRNAEGGVEFYFEFPICL